MYEYLQYFIWKAYYVYIDTYGLVFIHIERMLLIFIHHHFFPSLSHWTLFTSIERPVKVKNVLCFIFSIAKKYNAYGRIRSLQTIVCLLLCANKVNVKIDFKQNVKNKHTYFYHFKMKRRRRHQDLYGILIRGFMIFANRKWDCTEIHNVDFTHKRSILITRVVQVYLSYVQRSVLYTWLVK